MYQFRCMENKVLLADKPLGPIGKGLTGIFGIDPTSSDISITFNSAVSTIIAFLTVLASIFFLFQFFFAAFAWLGAGGNDKAVAAAKQKLINALLGLVIVVAAYAIIGLVGSIIGIDIFNPLGIFPGAGP